MKRKTVVSYFVSLLIFFLTVAVISVVSILTFDKIDEVSNGNNGVIALVLFLVILFFTVLYALIDALVDRMLHLTDEIEDAITDLEEDTVKDDSDPDPEGENIRTVYRMKRLVIRLGRMIYPLRDMVRTFERYDHPMLPPEMDMYFSDLYDHTLRAFDRIEHARMILQELQDFYHTEHERHTSDVLRVLTVVTAIFVPLTCIAGIYGMNFKNIPELNTEYGYFVTLGVMVAFIVASVIFFRVKRWM